MTQEYNFNVKAFYLLLSIVQKAEIDLNKVDDDNFIKSIVGGLVNAQDETIELMAVVTKQEVNKIEELSADEFITLVAGFVKSVKWEDIMGKLMNIVPETKQEQPEAQPEQ